ncbi:hypothetical protein HanRHA438_Chr09g0407991 [Helianthus annuus]|uniref:Uncharacterized protein n=1 Tax=Helianthus annuus TaxID=4232 RepID=A0A251VD71_HELAN|nr:hypothetical protein HanXRQr2_Chr11g0476461 [Helianthus annuus]KAF5791556.1 hypothetical protein HanXRQr2_Chr09g0396121 [Helianthus annuus]KAF5816945.1 hypothetical protein HanXRQr2_Chr02g0047371 [Helianthus annuus]KAJ0486388.1 hypothetical protein HanHA89_Chr14g0579121 [Helianthus annuus]KAJ0516416.1 hypothetical protein HanHA89_Chr11g0413621 [Helianthus annuus]
MSSSSGFSGDETAPFFSVSSALLPPLSSPVWGLHMGLLRVTTKSGVGVASLGVMRSGLVMLVLGMKRSRSGDKCLIQICWSGVVFVDM